MWLFVFGFAGFPLTGGFWGKIYIFSAAVDEGWTWLVVVGVIATAVSLVYYLAIVRAMYMRTAPEAGEGALATPPPTDRLVGTAVLLCAVVTVGTFFAVGPLADLARDAVDFLPVH
jgi:NADH-quinone oxidoreductase subunit N